MFRIHAAHVSEAAPEHHPRTGLRTDLLLAVGILLLAGPLIQVWSTQSAPRYSLTVAVIEERSLELDPYERVLNIDRATYRGHTYSDKAPYQPLLAAPILQAYRLAGGESFPVLMDGPDAFGQLVRAVNRGLWWVTLWSSTVPAMALAIVTRRTVASVHPALATVVAAAMAVGTLVLPFSSLLFGHVLAALWVALAWSLIRRQRLSARAAVGAGLCLGAAIGTEYTTAVLALAALIFVLAIHRPVGAAWLSIGTVVGTVPLLLYNWLVFEAPFEVSYQGHLPNFKGEGALGVYNLTAPKLEEVRQALASGKGLFVLTPVMLLAFIGCWYAIREATAARRDAVIALVGFTAMLLATTGIDGLGGASPGPRYLIPVLPLFAVPLAEAWRRWPLSCALTTSVGAVWMLLAADTIPLAKSPRDWVVATADGNFAANVLTGTSHTWVILIPTVAGLGVLLGLVRTDPDRGSPPGGA